MVDDASGGIGVVEIEVAYAKPEVQTIVNLKVPQSCTLEQAISLSGFLQQFPELGDSELKLGVFGVLGKLEQVVKQGDRVEIYRSLIHDPKEARRQRALNGGIKFKG